MSAKMITLLFILCCCASWTMAQSSPVTATPPAQTATPSAPPATPQTTPHVSAKPPEWIVAERHFSGKHAGLEFSGTSHAWHQHVAFDGEPQLRRTVLEPRPAGLRAARSR